MSIWKATNAIFFHSLTPTKISTSCLNKWNVAFPWTQNDASFIRELFAIEVKANMQHSLHLSCLLKFTVPCWCDDHLCEAPQAPLWVTNTTTWIDLSYIKPWKSNHHAYNMLAYDSPFFTQGFSRNLYCFNGGNDFLRNPIAKIYLSRFLSLAKAKSMASREILMVKGKYACTTTRRGESCAMKGKLVILCETFTKISGGDQK